MKMFLFLFLMLLGIQVAQATHLIGGYIQVKPVSGSTLTYQVTAVIYMHTGSATDQTSNATICLGNGTSAIATRVSQLLVQPDRTISINTYQLNYTYSGPGVYTITVSLSGRTSVKNIASTDTQTFALTTTFTTNTSLKNETPTPGFSSANFYAGINQKQTLSFKATDAEGDSLAYGLAKAYSENEVCQYQLIPSYKFPNDLTRKGTFKLNNRTGELVWDSPTEEGNYSLVLYIYEYRNGILISQTAQEITLTVADLPGTPGTVPAYEPAQETSDYIVTGTATYIDADLTLTTFPSPVEDRLQISLQTSNPTTATLQLLDINGRNVHELAFNKLSRQHEQTVDMGSLAPGIYLVRVNVNGRSVSRKIVKR